MLSADMLSRPYLTEDPGKTSEGFEQINMASFLPIADQKLEEIKRGTAGS